jgi:hypothetical protein
MWHAIKRKKSRYAQLRVYGINVALLYIFFAEIASMEKGKDNQQLILSLPSVNPCLYAST